ncbi:MULTISPECIES: hypothetical protein [unclassified Streptomyces]|uniref:hypothetical protein n=1 Tax=unclassified Streptomyces TaxID=2593676 RepID=UPI002E2AA610|nr:hypothetical protein [Streptomyces sp. NBC_00272]
MNATRHEDATATAIIGQKVLPGLEKEYEPWQENVNAAAADYPGALGSEISPPPSVTKTAIALWVGLYPTVVLLALATSPLKLPIWSGLLLGNLLSSHLDPPLTRRGRGAPATHGTEVVTDT